VQGTATPDKWNGFREWLQFVAFPYSGHVRAGVPLGPPGSWRSPVDKWGSPCTPCTHHAKDLQDTSRTLGCCSTLQGASQQRLAQV
jgi:hypothetical protein